MREASDIAYADVDFVLLVGVHLEVDFEDREDLSRDLGELNL